MRVGRDVPSQRHRHCKIPSVDATPVCFTAHSARFEEQHHELTRAPVAAAGTPEARTIHAEIKTIAESLHGSERHHEKEEHVLFPAPDSESIAEPVGTLAAMLRDHIHKENEVLYPMALSVIEAGAWEQLNRQADKIGACCCSCEKDGAHKD